MLCGFDAFGVVMGHSSRPLGESFRFFDGLTEPRRLPLLCHNSRMLGWNHSVKALLFIILYFKYKLYFKIQIQIQIILTNQRWAT